MKKPVFTGAGVAIITPFKSTGEVNYEEFGRIIDHQIAHHTDAIIVCGTTGEASALHDKEHREALAWCCKYVNHRVPVIAGTGSNDTAYAIELTKFAAECGAEYSTGRRICRIFRGPPSCRTAAIAGAAGVRRAFRR